MKTSIISLLLLSTTAFAATNGYHLKLDVSEGKHQSKAEMKVLAGKTSLYTEKNGSEERFIEVIATEGELQNYKGILMDISVGSIDAKGKKITSISKAKILVKENQAAQLTETEKNGSSLSISVIAKRIKL